MAGEVTEQEIQTSLEPDEQAPRLGRQLVDRFHDQLSDGELHEAKLLVSEVVTDAVRNSASDRIGLTIRKAGDELRAEVVNGGSDLEASSPERDGAWGSLILDRLADDWGVERRSGRTMTWFRLSTFSPRSRATSAGGSSRAR